MKQQRTIRKQKDVRLEILRSLTVAAFIGASLGFAVPVYADTTIGSDANDVIVNVNTDEGSMGGFKVVNRVAAPVTTFYNELNNTTITAGSNSLTLNSWSGTTIIGGLNNSSGGITNAGAISGASTINASSTVSAGSFSTSGALSSGSVSTGSVSSTSINNNGGGITSAGAISGATNITASGAVSSNSVSTGAISSTSINNGGGNISNVNTIGATTVNSTTVNSTTISNSGTTARARWA